MKNRFGSDVPLQIGIQSPQTQVQIVASSGNLGLVDKTVHAGEYHAIGYDLQGMSQQQLEATKSQLEQAKTKLESRQQVQLASLTKHDVTGAILQAGVQSYFAINQMQASIAQRQSNMVESPQLSFGTFSTHFAVVDRYGMPWQVSPKSMMMDIDRYFTLSIDRNNDAAKTIQFRAASGARMSANEHLVPEALFDDPNTAQKDAEGISAVKALKIAMQQGQKIYTITQSNQATVLPLLHHSAAVMQDITNALTAGKAVTVSASKITYNGWSGSGYILMDQQTGAGAYLIGGGMDGAIMTSISNSINNDSYNLTMYCALLSLISMAASFTAFTIAPPIVALLTIAILLISVGLAYATLVDMNSRCEGELYQSEPYFVLAFSILALALSLIPEFGAQILGLVEGTLIGVIGAGRCP